MFPRLLLDPAFQGIVEEVDKPEIQPHVSRSVREPLPGLGGDLVHEIVDGHFAAVEQPLRLQDSQLAAGVVAQLTEVRVEQTEKVILATNLLVPLKDGPGGAQVGAVVELALEDEV